MLTIQQQSSLCDNMSIVSNCFKFDEEGTAIGFSNKMITSSSKGDLHEEFAAISSKITVRGARGMQISPPHFVYIFRERATLFWSEILWETHT